MRRILCLHLPYLATERVQRDHAPADDRPLVLTRPVGASLVIEQACPRARQCGVRPGTSLGQAQALAPHLVAWPQDAQRDRLALLRLARWVLRFSPTVEPVEPQTLLVDITGCQQLFRGEHNILQQAIAGLAEQGFFARAAIADTLGAAWALATADPQPLSIAPPGQTTPQLAPLPPATLRIDSQTAARLDALGVRTIGDLLMLPRTTLPARFGRHLVLRLQQALGEIFESVTPYRPDDPPLARLPCEVPLTELPPLSAAVAHLLADVFEQLRRRGAALRRLDCVLHYDHRPPHVVSIGLARASREPKHVLQLLHQRLEQADLSAGVVGITLAARQTSRWRGVQGELFEPRASGDEEALAGLIDRLAARLGYEALVRPQRIDDHQPEMAYRYVTVAQVGCLPEPRPSTSEGSRPRPVHLWPRPIPIRVIALLPDGPPTWLFCHGREQFLAHADGPERLETAWWRGPDVRRDYFRVTTETGAQLWIFHARDEGQWYLHGVFS